MPIVKYLFSDQCFWLFVYKSAKERMLDYGALLGYAGTIPLQSMKVTQWKTGFNVYKIIFNF